MINRIRVVTLLVMVLGVFALLQLISGSLFFYPIFERTEEPQT